jgi:ribonucleotide reductase alpha subunit
MVQPYKLEFKNQPLMVYVKNLLEIYVGKSQLDGSERTITINPTSLDNFSDISKTVMQGKHLMPGETILQGFARACCAFSDDSAHAQRLLDYASKGWFKFPTPVLSNGGTEKGLAINCYLSQIGDDMGSIAEHFAEAGVSVLICLFCAPSVHQHLKETTHRELSLFAVLSILKF